MGPLHEILVVIPDLYLPRDWQRARAVEPALGGLEHLARFGRREPLGAGWRAWLAGWAGAGDRVASLAPAVVAACARRRGSRERSRPAPALGAASVWMATPVHLVTSLASLHLDRRSVLYPGASEQLALVEDFGRTFEGSGFQLDMLEGGGMLLFGPVSLPAQTQEPARAMGESLAEALPRGPGAAALRKMGGEIEMWLHGHALNQAREGRGELTVTALWLWGGGAADPPLLAADQGDPDSSERIAFGLDEYLRGLFAHIGARVLPLPVQFTEILSYSRARAAVLVVEAGRMLEVDRNWTLPEAVAEIDRRFLVPAVRALQGRALGRLQVLANDWLLSLLARHRLRRWRRARPGLSGLL